MPAAVVASIACAAGGLFGQAEVVEHHGGAADGGRWVGQSCPAMPIRNLCVALIVLLGTSGAGGVSMGRSVLVTPCSRAYADSSWMCR